jgi:PDZ domain-containing secreted protein
MTTLAFKGGLTFKVGDGAGPEVFTTLEEVKSVSGFGKTNELVDVTNFSSANNTKEYISGLADGAEITVECNRRNTTATVQNQLIDDVDDQESARNIRITWTDGTTSKQYDFAVVCLSYTYGPSIADANKITYTLKITGDITVS